MTDPLLLTPVMPDPEILLVRYLGRLNPGLQIGTAVPADPAKLDHPVVSLTLLPAPPSSVPIWLDLARVQVDSWASSSAGGRTEASAIARRLHAHLKAARNVVYADGIISSTTTVSGPGWVPDSTRTPPTPRYSLTMDVRTHPVP